ncbi:MAG: hypothetical protein H0T73_14965 [Ardenticatenales bacterium]|nr:hypothetical protein [Ardenticatenales bacterium]
MPFARPVKEAVIHALAAMERHPQHHLLPIHRLAIYNAIRQAYNETAANYLRAHLGILTARRVLPFWHAVTPIYPGTETPDGCPGDLYAEHFLFLALRTLEPKPPQELISLELANEWYSMGNLGDEFFEWRTPTSEGSAAYLALRAAYFAPYEALGKEFLAGVSDLEEHTDDTLWLLHPYRSDAAGAAVLAIVGSDEFEKEPATSAAQRLAFWRWWLVEALPQARALADR